VELGGQAQEAVATQVTVRGALTTNVAMVSTDTPVTDITAGVILGSLPAGLALARRLKEADMYLYLPLSVSPYPNSALSAVQLAIIAVIPVLTLAAWLILVFAADRHPRHRRAAGTTPLPQQPPAQEQEREQPERKAA
jgi:hypothetical protein